MKYYSKFAALVVLGNLLMVSCKKDDDNSVANANAAKALIIGEWSYQSVTTEAPVHWTNGYYGTHGENDWKDCQNDDYLSFTVQGYVYDNDGDFPCDPDKGVSGNLFSIPDAGTLKLGNVVYDLLVVDSTTLQIRSRDSIAVTTTFTRRHATVPDLNGVGTTGSVNAVYQGKSVTLATVKAKDGNIWLQQNLGAAQVAVSPGDTNAYGHYFQWGRWDDGHQLPTSPVLPAITTQMTPVMLSGGKSAFYRDWWTQGDANSRWAAVRPDQATEQNGCDPCKALGGDWRMPRLSEWKKVFAAEGITDVATGFQSNLKLPGAGVRGYRGVENPGPYGHYWTNTATTLNILPGTSATAGAAYSVNLMDNVDIRPTQFYNAMSVRCILAK